MRKQATITVLLALVIAAGCNDGGGGEQGKRSTGSTPGAAKSTDPDAARVVASYANKTLTRRDVMVELEKLPGPSRAYVAAPERKRQFIDNLVLNDLLFEEGRKEGLDSDPDIERQVEDLRRRLVVQRVMRKFQTPPEISDEQVRKYYDDNQTLYAGTQVRASHILVKDEETAKRISTDLRAHPEKFADVAKEKSTDTATAPKGGDLGLFGQGRMVPEFEKAAFSMKEGQISDPVKTQYGYHVIMVTERKEGTPKPFEQVKDQIRATMRNKASQDATQNHFDELKKNANLKVDEAVLADITPPPSTGPGASPMFPMGH